jgi:hypothetical protein
MMNGQAMADHMQGHMANGQMMGGAQGGQGMMGGGQAMGASGMMGGAQNPHCNPDAGKAAPKP